MHSVRRQVVALSEAVTMIEVERLTRNYGSRQAVQSISFAVGSGQVVGFLGPNGAGKTTTMRMLTTYLTPTSGRARLAGFDVLDQPIDVRRSVGYLPEQVPLYPEMRVGEFLRYRAGLKDVPRFQRKSAVARTVSRCGLADVTGRVIGQLSKGYRQRVGLADALLADPPILILDEPTAGLDPLQVREVRQLVRELGQAHTVLLSTHILPEVETLCSRAIVIAQGRIVLDDSLEHLQKGRAIELELRGESEMLRRLLESCPGVVRVRLMDSPAGSVGFFLETEGQTDLRPQVVQRLVQNGVGVLRVDQSRSTLEDRFVKAVGGSLESSALTPEAA